MVWTSRPVKSLKGGVREILAASYLEALGVNTSKAFSLIETGEELHRRLLLAPQLASLCTVGLGAALMLLGVAPLGHGGIITIAAAALALVIGLSAVDIQRQRAAGIDQTQTGAPTASALDGRGKWGRF